MNHRIQPAWKFPFAQTLPLPSYDGKGITLKVEGTDDPAERHDHLGLGIGRWPASDDNGIYENFVITGYDTLRQPTDTFDGIQIRGRATLRDVIVSHVKGIRGLGIEAFGIRSSNEDAHGPGQGGIRIERCAVKASINSTYTTGICIGTWFDGPRPYVEPSFVNECFINLSDDDHAGLTATYLTVIKDTVVVGPAYDFYVDTLPMLNIEIIGSSAAIHKAAVSLYAINGQYKRNLTIRNRTYDFLQPKGNLYALELSSDGKPTKDGERLFDNITFENCVFNLSYSNTPFYLFSTAYEGSPHVEFKGCVIPTAAKVHAKNPQMLDNVYINGSPMRKVMSL